MTPITEGGVMTAWTPPEFSYFKTPDGAFLAIDENGDALDCQPTLTTQMVDGTESVVDPWGNVVEEYEPPPYTIHVVTNWPSGMQHGVAVDADGMPLPLVPTVRVMRTGVNHADVMLADGTEVAVPMYPGPEKFHIHVEWSSTRLEQGTPDHVFVAVDANGVPLLVQPENMGGDPTDVSSLWASWGGGPVSVPPYEFPEFSVYLEYPDSAIRGAAAAAPIPIAVGADGKPLPTQPDFEVDPTDPTNVVAILPNGDKYDAPGYELPSFRVHLVYPEGSQSGRAAPIPTAIAVDESGVPLPIQPHLDVDPADHTQVTATLSDFTTLRVEVQPLPKDFYVFVEASGPPSEHGAPTFVAVAVDASGTPLPIQPLFEDLDPTDLANVKAVFPDGSVYEPPPLYPPPGTPPGDWPPVPWPPVEVAPSEEEDAGAAEDAAVDEVVGADSADDLDPVADAADDAQQADSDAPTTGESTDIPQEETGEDGSVLDRDPAKSYSGVRLSEGDVLLDDDSSADETEGEGRADVASPDLLTVGLVDSMPDDGVVSATPIPLPIEAMPVGGEVVSATPIPLPIEAMPVGGDTASVLPIPNPGPQAVSDFDGDEIALDRKGDDRPVDTKIPGTTEESAAEFRVEVIDEVQVEEVRLEDVESGDIELAESIVDRGDILIEEEDVGDLDG